MSDRLSDERLAEIQRALYRAEERIDQLQAQLANLRRTVESWSDRGMVLVSDVLAELDEADIPTPPEAEGVPPEPKTRRPIDVTLSPREASPPPPAVDPREEDDA